MSARMSGPPRKPRKQTATTKAHRFEPFTRRIAKIKIDPVHTVQKSRLTEGYNDLSSSYFRSALDEWSELNLSQTFTSFLNKANPLSESLPQLLHHADKIFRLLIEHIEKREEIALEPLLSLVAHLAHDLGRVFEKHFVETVKVVTQVSASIEDPAAIESCFTCLAWMFKYLSKSIVRDSRPLLDIIIPHMSSKKAYVRRFSAESLAFILRKLAILHSKDPRPLQETLLHLFAQLEVVNNRKPAELLAYRNALMTLLGESAMGIDAQLHSCAANLMRGAFVVFEQISSESGDSLTSVLEGVTINLIHQTTAAGFRLLCDLVSSSAMDSQNHTSNLRLLWLRLLTAVAGTRKGSRVENWDSIINAVLTVNQKLISAPVQSRAEQIVGMSLSAAVIQYSSMDQMLPYLNKIIESATSGMSPAQFFTFCEVVADLGKQRFRDLLLPRLQAFILARWNEDERGLCLLLSRLDGEGIVSSTSYDKSCLTVSEDWETAIQQRLEEACHEDVIEEQAAFQFQVMRAMHIPRKTAPRANVATLLSKVVKGALGSSNDILSQAKTLTLGWCFQSYLELQEEPSIDDWEMLWRGVIQQNRHLFTLVPFLDVCTVIAQNMDARTPKRFGAGNLLTALIDNMLHENVTIRGRGIEILLRYGQLCGDEWLIETSELLLELIRMPYLPSSARQIEMLIRRLPTQQVKVANGSLLQKLVPLFTLGLMRNYHDHTRRALCTTLKQMVAFEGVEDMIINVATQWLQSPSSQDRLMPPRDAEDNSAELSPFECSNLNQIRTSSHEMYERYHLRSEQELNLHFVAAHQLRPVQTPRDSRSMALQLFLEMPEVAERRSRMLVPVFLLISRAKAHHHVPPSHESTSSHTASPDIVDQTWSLRDRKTFLELMSKFGNPKVLYRSREVHDELMELLTNGNTDIRKLALQSLLNWKDASLSRYDDVLLRVAEEKTATTELALLLSNNEDSGAIKPRDRSAVLPTLLRLIFGQLIGRSGNHGSQEAKRKSILRLLFRMAEEEIYLFLEIAQGRLASVVVSDNGHFAPHVLELDLINPDQQYGFLRMMLSMLEILQSQFAPYGHKIVTSVLYCTARACHQADAENIDGESTTALVRNIRRTGLQCLVLLSEQCPELDWSPYTGMVFSKLVSPRLSKFAVETAQGVSVLLRFFSVWARSARLCSMLQDHDPKLLGTLWHILVVSSARDDVKLFVVQQIMTPLTEIASNASNSSSAATEIVSQETDPMLQSLAFVLQNQPSKDLLLAVTRLIQHLAPFVKTPVAASNVLDLLVTLLCEPSQRIPPHIKGSLLHAMESLLQFEGIDLQAVSTGKLYTVVANLYGYFKDQPNRVIVGKILMTLNQGNHVLVDAIRICEDLNSHSTIHLDEVDYEKRIAAFNDINNLDIDSGTRLQWLPILQNLLYFSRTAEDFAIRSNAVNCLKRYIFEACQTANPEMNSLVREPLLLAFKKGIKEDSELVRADFVGLFGLVVKNLKDAPELQDLKVLLVGDDEEASFFMNILHIQQHRRLRAIRRLVLEVGHGKITPLSISEFCLPVLEKFINDESPDESAQGVKGQSIAATSVLLQWVDWKIFRRIFRQYKQDLVTGSRPEKDTIKLLHNASDALTSAAEGVDTHKQAGDVRPELGATLPSTDIIQEELKTNFIPKLSNFIHHKDEALLSLRIPAAQIAVKLIKLLTSEEIPLLVAPILLDISQILRSRTQESRDIARNTLAGIVELMGPSSVQFVLKELRTTLTRGYQLHVLSYTMHTILLRSSPHHELGDLDYCADELVAVVMDDIFGTAGQEKQNEDYISDMKEVKSSKSFDSMELLAKTTSVRAMSKLVAPFRSLLTGTLPSKQLRHVDELLRRLGVGIAHNVAATSRDLLVFAYELIQAFYKQKATLPARVLTNDEKNRARYIVQLESAHKATSGTSSTLLYKIARFALDIVRSTLLKHPALLTVENVHGFLPVIGDALIEGQEDVKTSALRLLAAIIKLPLVELDKNAALYVIEAVKVVKGSISTNDEASQAALKLVAAVLRERRDVEVRDSDVSYLLHRTMPDLEEPDRQGVTFNFIKSVMACKYELPEVYELVDKIGVMMVTSQSRNSRDAARGVYVHFLLEYPQSKNRWLKQLKFLVKNLEYQYPEGRQSVMEAIHILLQKTGNEIAQELVSTFFTPIILRMTNDDHASCRELAGALLSKIYSKADQTQLKALLDPLRAWLAQNDNMTLTKLSLQAWTIFFDVAPEGALSELPAVRSSVTQILSKELAHSDEDWEEYYHALELLQKLFDRFPATVVTPKQRELWVSVCTLLNTRHPWIQSSAASLLGRFFANCSSDGSTQIPLTTSHGLKLGEEPILDLLRNSIRLLKRNEGNQDLADKTAENLLFLARYVDTNNLTMKVKAHSNMEAETDDPKVAVDDLSNTDPSSNEEEVSTKSIPALQYFLDQCVHILRREPSRLTSAAFVPRLSSLQLLTTLLPSLDKTSLPTSTTTALLIPLTYITDPNMLPPRSADPTFPQTYEVYTTAARSLLEAVQSKVGDGEYIRLMTEVSKIVRARREGRRQKRAIEKVAEPERAAKYKKRKADGKRDRKKEITDLHKKKRRSDLGF